MLFRSYVYMLLFGMWLGVLLCAGVEKYGDSYYNRQNVILEDCQKHLPRDQVCRLVAVPVDKE